MSKRVEAFAVYHLQKENLTNYLQVSSAGLALLRRTIDVPNAPALLGALVDACGVKHWVKGKHFRSAAAQVDAGVAALADVGIIQQMAAFDIFTRAVVQDLARFSARARASFPALSHPHELLKLSPAGRWVSDHCCNDLAGRLDTLSRRLDELHSWIGWTPSPKLKPTLPLFDLVRSVRNRIAHDGGTVGSDLAELADSKEIAVALATFRIGYAKGDLPPLPKFSRNKPLGLGVVHAILFGAFLYEVAKEVNSHAAGLIDDAEFIDMAFYYSSVVDEHPFRTIKHRSAENRVGHFLSRYLRTRSGPSSSDVIRHLAARQLGTGAAATTYWRVALLRHQALLAAPIPS